MISKKLHRRVIQLRELQHELTKYEHRAQAYNKVLCQIPASGEASDPWEDSEEWAARNSKNETRLEIRQMVLALLHENTAHIARIRAKVNELEKGLEPGNIPTDS